MERMSALGTCQRSRISGPKRCYRKAIIQLRTSYGLPVAVCAGCYHRYGSILAPVPMGQTA